MIKKISNKYNQVCTDLVQFKKDKFNRSKSLFNFENSKIESEKKNIKQKISILVEKAKINTLIRIVKADDYRIGILQSISAAMSTLGIAIKNKWIKLDSGIAYKYIPICLLVCFIFYLIQSISYKHFGNVPFLLKNFDNDNRKQKIINITSIIVCGFVWGMSIWSNVLALQKSGCDGVTSRFCGYGIDIMSILCVWYRTKFTTLTGYNDDIEKSNDDIADKKDEKQKQIAYILEKIKNTQPGERIVKTYDDKVSADTWYKILNKHELVEKRGSKYYKKAV